MEDLLSEIERQGGGEDSHLSLVDQWYYCIAFFAHLGVVYFDCFWEVH